MEQTFVFEENVYTFVRDHCPEDHPVVPFVSAVDALYTTIQKRFGPCILKDIRLVKGIIVPNFRTFNMYVEINQEQQIVQLIGEDGTVHYKATYQEYEDHLKPAYESLKDPQKDLKGDYEFLFHGPMLHSIVSIQTNETISEATGVLKTALGMNWPKVDWFFDPFVCDGALQMGCQLAFMTKQKASLPSKIRQAIFYQKPVDQEVLVHIVFQKMSGLHYVFDAHMFDKNYQPICSLEGVESYFRLFKNS